MSTGCTRWSPDLRPFLKRKFWELHFRKKCACRNNSLQRQRVSDHSALRRALPAALAAGDDCRASGGRWFGGNAAPISRSGGVHPRVKSRRWPALQRRPAHATPRRGVLARARPGLCEDRCVKVFSGFFPLVFRPRASAFLWSRRRRIGFAQGLAAGAQPGAGVITVVAPRFPRPELSEVAQPPGTDQTRVSGISFPRFGRVAPSSSLCHFRAGPAGHRCFIAKLSDARAIPVNVVRR